MRSTAESSATHRTTRTGALRVGELTDGYDVCTRLFDPIPAGDAEVEHSVGHVERDLLRTKYPHLVDPGIVDARPVVDIRTSLDREVGVTEELHGRRLE
jgi:hypothetical protein